MKVGYLDTESEYAKHEFRRKLENGVVIDVWSTKGVGYHYFMLCGPVLLSQYVEGSYSPEGWSPKDFFKRHSEPFADAAGKALVTKLLGDRIRQLESQAQTIAAELTQLDEVVTDLLKG